MNLILILPCIFAGISERERKRRQNISNTKVGISLDLLRKAMEIHELDMDVRVKDTSIRKHKWNLVTEYYNGVKQNEPGQMRTKEQLQQFMKNQRKRQFKQKW